MSDGYYDKEGHEITQDDWVELSKKESKMVCYTVVGDSGVSTVWLGIDHRLGEGRPLIFETLIMGGPNANDMWRYTTSEEAEFGHLEVVKALIAGRIDMSEVPE